MLHLNHLHHLIVLIKIMKNKRNAEKGALFKFSRFRKGWTALPCIHLVHHFPERVSSQQAIANASPAAGLATLEGRDLSCHGGMESDLISPLYEERASLAMSAGSTVICFYSR